MDRWKAASAGTSTSVPRLNSRFQEERASGQPRMGLQCFWLGKEVKGCRPSDLDPVGERLGALTASTLTMSLLTHVSPPARHPRPLAGRLGPAPATPGWLSRPGARAPWLAVHGRPGPGPTTPGWPSGPGTHAPWLAFHGHPGPAPTPPGWPSEPALGFGDWPKLSSGTSARVAPIGTVSHGPLTKTTQPRVLAPRPSSGARLWLQAPRRTQQRLSVSECQELPRKLVKNAVCQAHHAQKVLSSSSREPSNGGFATRLFWCRQAVVCACRSREGQFPHLASQAGWRRALSSALRPDSQLGEWLDTACSPQGPGCSIGVMQVPSHCRGRCEARADPQPSAPRRYMPHKLTSASLSGSHDSSHLVLSPSPLTACQSSHPPGSCSPAAGNHAGLHRLAFS